MKHYGLIGNPLGHSFSADFFTQLFRSRGIDAVYTPYELAHITELADLLERVPLVGLNVTSPYKQAVLHYAHTLAPEVEAVGAANVLRIVRRTDGTIGHIVAHNTDVIGFAQPLEGRIEPNSLALVLGTGGAARACRYALNMLGCRVLLVSRTPQGDGIVPYDALEGLLHETRLIVQATPIGLHPGECIALPYDLIDERHLCYDLIYNPRETEFLRLAHQRGAETLNGLAMLHAQALAAWDLWQAGQ